MSMYRFVAVLLRTVWHTGSCAMNPMVKLIHPSLFLLKRTAFVSFITAGFPEPSHTVEIMKAMEAGGSDIIELGVPFSDPLADGATIQKASIKALKAGITVGRCLDIVKTARAEGVTVPVILMGYLNPMLAYGFQKLAKEAQEAGADGFIIVDLPGEECHDIIQALNDHKLSYIPLVCICRK